MASQEFQNGWSAAQSDEYMGQPRREEFPSYRTAEFIRGYNGFWCQYDSRLAQAEHDAIVDYDNNAGYRNR